MTLPVALPVPWRAIGAVALVLAVAALGWRVTRWHDAYRRLGSVEAELQAERECQPGTKCAERVRAWQADGLAAVERARQAAQEAAGREQARRDAEAAAALKRAAVATSEARVRADRWRARYEAAKQQPECAKWAESPISCPSS